MFVKKRSEPERRVPTQERARQRFERILDAAALVFADGGFEAATMEAIAAQAETSIGSIYQFFPNKLAVFEEIARRYREKLRAFFDAIVDGPLIERPVGELIDAAVEAVWAFHENEPAFRAVWVGVGPTEEVLVQGEALNRELARRIESLLAKKLGGLPEKQRPVVATMVVEVMTAMLIASARRDATQRGGKPTRPTRPTRPTSTEMKEETKMLLDRYLSAYAVRSAR